MSQSISQDQWNHWYNRVYGFFYRRVDSPSDVDDLTAMTLNDFFLKENVNNPQGLIWVIARNKLTDFIRSKPKHRVSDIDNVPQHLLVNTDNYTQYYQDRLERLKHCVQSNLKEQDYKIVELCAMYDFSSEKVAAELSLSSANVRQKLSRSLKKVREICAKIWQNT